MQITFPSVFAAPDSLGCWLFDWNLRDTPNPVPVKLLGPEPPPAGPVESADDLDAFM